jgi:hypothetical protein
MATYYKYAEKNVSSEINWAEVGKNLTDMLKEENRIREEAKAKIDEDSRKFGETLANSPTGDSTSMNEWSLRFGANAQEARLTQDRLLKSGQMKLKDYNIMRQNLLDGTNTAFTLIKEYQDEYKRKMERANNADPSQRSQLLERFYMESAEGFMNFANSDLYINPTNYQVSVGKRKADGSMSDNPNDYFTVNDMRMRVKQDVNYFDYDKALDSWVGDLGKYSEVVQAAGGWKVITDPTARDKYLQTLDPVTKKKVTQTINQFQLAMDDQLKSFGVANPFNFTSVLTDDIGGYGFTFDANEAAKDPTKILMKKDPNNVNGPAIPDFTTANGKQQEEKVLEFLRQQATVKLEHTETYTQKTQQRFDSEYAKYRDEKKLNADALNVWNKLHTSTNPAERQAAINTILGMQRNQQRGLVDIKFSDDGTGVTFVYQNPAMNRTMPYSQNTTLLQWSQIGNEIHGIDDAAATLKASGGGDPNATMADPNGLNGLEANRQGGPLGGSTTVPLTQSDINKGIQDSFISAGQDEATQMATNLENAFADTGFSFIPEEGGFGDSRDNIKVLYNGNVVGTYQVDNNGDLLKMQREMTAATKTPAKNTTPAKGGAGNSGGKARGG